jgi:O-antigen ligase
VHALRFIAPAAALFLSSALFSHDVALRMVLLALATALCIAAAAKERGWLPPPPPIWLAFLLWGAWAALSLAWSQEPARSEKELRNEVVYVAFAFAVCYLAARAENAFRTVLPIAGAAAALLCLVALYYFAFDAQGYATGWHGGPGDLSSAVLTLFPCAALAAWYGRAQGLARLHAAGWIGIALLLAAAHTTGNRTVWLALGLEVVLIVALLYLRAARLGHPWLRARTAAVICVAFAVAGLAMAAHVQSERPRALENDLRLQLWPVVMEYVKERPLTGYGFGRGLLREALTSRTAVTNLWHAHNLFLDVVVQTGVIGLALFLYLLFATVRAGWRLAAAQPALASACGIALVTVVAGMLARNMTDVLWLRQNSLLFWGVVALLLSWGTALEARRAG